MAICPGHVGHATCWSTPGGWVNIRNPNGTVCLLLNRSSVGRKYELLWTHKWVWVTSFRRSGRRVGFFRKGSLKDWTMLQRAILDRFYSFPWNGVVSKLHQANETSPINVGWNGNTTYKSGIIMKISWTFQRATFDYRRVSFVLR